MKLVTFAFPFLLSSGIMLTIVTFLYFVWYLSPYIVVNCVQCHPFDCVVATSGIDNTIKVNWKKYLLEISDQIELAINNFDFPDLDSKCFSPIDCGWWSSRTRDCKYLRCHGKQSAETVS